MTSRTATHAWPSTPLPGAPALSARSARPQPLLAQANACTLVSTGDAAALLGGSPTQKPTPGGGACAWVGTDGRHKLAVLTYKNRPGAPPGMICMGARKNAESEHADVSDEAGMGDRAFSAPVSFGAIMVAIKHGRVIQMQYWTGARGTTRDVTTLGPIVRRMVAVFQSGGTQGRSFHEGPAAADGRCPHSARRPRRPAGCFRRPNSCAHRLPRATARIPAETAA